MRLDKRGHDQRRHDKRRQNVTIEDRAKRGNSRGDKSVGYATKRDKSREARR